MLQDFFRNEFVVQRVGRERVQLLLPDFLNSLDPAFELLEAEFLSVNIEFRLHDRHFGESVSPPAAFQYEQVIKNDIFKYMKVKIMVWFELDFLSFQRELGKNGVSVFSLLDACRIVGKKPAYCKVFLGRLVKARKLLRIERGKYCLPDADLLEVASNLVSPSYVSFLSALAFHALTTQIPVEVQVACLRQKKPVYFGNSKIAFVKIKRSALFGFKREGNAFVAEPEKAVVDGLRLPARLPVSEAFYALKQGALSAAKLEDFAERTGSSIVRRRLGFLLERAGLESGIKPDGVKFGLLNPALAGKGVRNRKWKLVVNEVLE